MSEVDLKTYHCKLHHPPHPVTSSLIETSSSERAAEIYVEERAMELSGVVGIVVKVTDTETGDFKHFSVMSYEVTCYHAEEVTLDG